MALWTPFQHIFSAAPVITNIPLQLRIITLNVRYATSSPSTGERPWVEREPLILNQLYHELRYTSLPPSPNNTSSINQPFSSCCAAFICLQEALHSQLVDILAGLNEVPASERNENPLSGPNWAHVGVGRDDGDRKGEYSPILYPVKTFSLLDSETVWLSPTPHRPSKGWDAGSIRILTIAVFEHIQTKQRVLAANTHLDNAGSKSRAESVKIILATMRRIHKKWSTRGADLAVFLAGDFNSFPEQEAYVAIKEDAWLRDLHDDIEPQKRYGNVITFTGFQPDKEKDEQGRIDFLWLGPCGSGSDDKTPWTPVGYAVLPNIFENGIYLSDHRAVVGDMLLYP
ncbi:endonuclease/exonuclease/phosphatase [Xylariaceae sp. FL1651]|nr:endonuclease/exonuclease/phosphatase [Xylariaceae sp. FL1651]